MIATGAASATSPVFIPQRGTTNTGYSGDSTNLYGVIGGATASTLSATAFNLPYLTASEMLITDASKNIVSAPVATYPSLTELTYLKGVTSAIQTQLNAKGAGTVTSVGWTGGIVSIATATTTPAFTIAGTSGGIPYFNSATTWATSAALAANALVVGGGAGVAPSTTTTGTGVLTALGINVGSAGAFVTFNGALGTPSSGVATNITGLPAGAILPGTLVAGTYLLAENASIGLDPAGSADGKYSGTTITGISGYAQAFGDLVTLDKDDSRWEAVDISVAAAATGDARGIMGMVVSAGTDGNACTILLQGIIRADANFPALTIGAAVYASTTGDIVVTQPSTVDYVIRIVGHAMTADEIMFNPDNSWITHT
jgi:hypothetical protein